MTELYLRRRKTQDVVRYIGNRYRLNVDQSDVILDYLYYYFDVDPLTCEDHELGYYLNRAYAMYSANHTGKPTDEPVGYRNFTSLDSDYKKA